MLPQIVSGNGFIAKAVIILLAATQISATPVPADAAVETTSTTCTSPIIRKEWRTLTTAQKKSYIAAVQCLQTLPSKSDKTKIPGAKYRYDDFVAQHSIHMMSIHFVGQFAPYHRYFVASYEQALRKECGYTGANPYWDWSLDSATQATFLKSPVFDTTLGFGGNGAFVDYDTGVAQGLSAPLGDVVGRTGGGCVTDGPFKTWTTRLGPGADLSGSAGSVCLRRDFSPLIATKFLNKTDIATTLKQPDFGWFNIVLDGDARTGLPPNLDYRSIHTGGHWSVGGSFGQITDLFVSPSDPLFFLHHANVDRAFWTWQTKKLPTRFFDISGNVIFQDYENEQGGNVTAAYVIDVGAVNAKNTTVGAVMNIQGGTLCYGYDALVTV